MQDTFLIRFVIDAVKRFLSKTPWFFKVIQAVSGAAFLYVGLPGLLVWFCDYTNEIVCLSIPDAWQAQYNASAAWVSSALVILAQFAVKSDTIANKNIKE